MGQSLELPTYTSHLFLLLSLNSHDTLLLMAPSTEPTQRTSIKPPKITSLTLPFITCEMNINMIPTL